MKSMVMSVVRVFISVISLNKLIVYISTSSVNKMSWGLEVRVLYNNTDMVTIKTAKKTKTKTHLLIKTSESFILLK